MSSEKISAKKMALYIKKGKALLLFKKQCKHGQFLKFINENSRIKIRECQRYMKLAKNEEMAIKQKSIRHAMELI